MIATTTSFKKNLALLPSIAGLARIDLIDRTDGIVGCIENQAGQQGSLSVYQYLHQCFGELNAQAAAHGLAVFAEHTEDARSRPGAHPNIDRLFKIADGADPLNIALIEA